MAEGGEDRREKVLLVAFTTGTQDLILSRHNMCSVYSLQTPCTVQNIAEVDFRSHIIHADKLASSALMAFVSKREPRLLILYNIRTGQSILNLSFRREVLAVQMNKRRLAICTEDVIYVYDIPFPREGTPILRQLETTRNGAGLMALSPGPDGVGCLAYPGCDTTGVGIVLGLRRGQSAFSNSEQMHTNPLKALAFNKGGTRLVSASTNGFIVRVWSIPALVKTHEFRRGVMTPAIVQCLSFSRCSSFVVLTSTSPTVHIFKLTSQPVIPRENLSEEFLPEQSWGEWLEGNVRSAWTSARKAVDKYVLPKTWCTSQERSYAKAYIPAKSADCQKVATLLQNTKPFHLCVVTDDGILYAYTFNPEVEGILVMVFKVFLRHPSCELASPSEEELDPIALTGNRTDDSFMNWRQNFLAKVRRMRVERMIEENCSYAREVSVTQSPDNGGETATLPRQEATRNSEDERANTEESLDASANPVFLFPNSTRQQHSSSQTRDVRNSNEEFPEGLQRERHREKGEPKTHGATWEDEFKEFPPKKEERRRMEARTLPGRSVERRIGSGSRIGPGSRVGSELRVGPEARTGAGPRVGPEPRIGPAPGSRAGPKPRSGSGPRVGSGPDTGPEPRTEPRSRAGPGTRADSRCRQDRTRILQQR